MILDDGKNYHQVGNALVEDDALRIAQAVKDYDEDLDIICLDPSLPGVSINSAPFILVCRMPDGTYQKVFDAWQLDERILERLWAADNQRFDQLATIDRINSGVKMDKEHRYREKMDDNGELAVAILKSQKSSYTFQNEKGDEVKINERGPVERNKNRKSFS